MSTTIIYKDVAAGAKEAATAAMPNVQPFSNLENLKTSPAVPAVATLEQDYWSLDGSFGLFPDGYTGDWGVWSDVLSGADGTLFPSPVLTLTLPQPVSSDGITLRFDEYGPTWASEVGIEWLSGGTTKSTAVFYPDGPEYTCSEIVSDYDEVIITFSALNRPGQYLKLTDLDFGATVRLTGNQLRNVHLYQTANPISQTVEINTLSCTVSPGAALAFERRQELDVYQDGALQGVFYLTRTRQVGTMTYEIEAEDALSLLDDEQHLGGMYYDESAPTLIADIMGAVPYALDPSFSGATVTGYLPVASRRENLAQVAFAIGAVVDTSGSAVVKIKPASEAVTAAFDRSTAYDNGTIEKQDPATSVEVTAHAYYLNFQRTQTLYNDTLNGTALVTFDAPMHDLQITGGTIVSSGANHAVISGTGSLVVLTGDVYIESKRVYKADNPAAPAGSRPNVVQVSNATLVSLNNVQDVLARVLAYYSSREKLNIRLILGSAMPGDLVTVSGPFGGTKTGYLESAEINLSRKRVGEAVIACL